jgi:peroxiredoxin
MGRFLLAAFVSAAVLLGQDFKLGARVDDFTLSDESGATVDFAALRGPVTVVTFIATRCPVSNSYNERMNAMYKDYSVRGVKFVFINANQNEPLAEVAEHAKSHFVFPVYKDPNDAVANRFGASVTPEAFVIDRAGIIRYHGSIDDSMNVQRVRENRLRDALEEVLAGRPVEHAQTKAFGCSIKREKKTT